MCNPDGNHAFHGNLGGAQGIYEYRPLNDFYAGVKFFWKQGITDGGSAGKRFIFYIDVQERMGYTAVIKRGVSEISLYSGIGYHYLNHKLTTSGNAPLRFGYNEFYVPVGFALNNNFYSWFAWGVNATWMPQVFSTVSNSLLMASSTVPAVGGLFGLVRFFAEKILNEVVLVAVEPLLGARKEVAAGPPLVAVKTN